LSIVIPVLNEEEEIVGILDVASKLLADRGGDGEILVVDNASTDRTCARVEPFLGDGRVRLLKNEINRGKGFSIRRGMLEARGDLRLMCDADCVASLSSLPRLEAAAERVDVVVGSRLKDGAHVARQQPFRRRVVGAGFLALTRVMVGRLPRDVYCGFKLWSADSARDVFGRVQLDGWAFDAEALAMAQRLGYQVEEVGIEWSNRPDSRLSIRTVLFRVVGELLAARRSVRRAAPAGRPVAPPPRSSSTDTAVSPEPGAPPQPPEPSQSEQAH
jgi:glycosyltransferase involved in cell wall biosynthesis